MKTKEQYFKEREEIANKRAKERKEKWTQEITEEIKDWDSDKLEEEYLKLRLGRISYHNPSLDWTVWNMFHDLCRLCDIEYIEGKHDDCCDDCFEKNKGKTLEELENE